MSTTNEYLSAEQARLYERERDYEIGWHGSESVARSQPPNSNAKYWVFAGLLAVALGWPFIAFLASFLGMVLR